MSNFTADPLPLLLTQFDQLQLGALRPVGDAILMYEADGGAAVLHSHFMHPVPQYNVKPGEVDEISVRTPRKPCGACGASIQTHCHLIFYRLHRFCGLAGNYGLAGKPVSRNCMLRKTYHHNPFHLLLIRRSLPTWSLNFRHNQRPIMFSRVTFRCIFRIFLVSLLLHSRHTSNRPPGRGSLRSPLVRACSLPRSCSLSRDRNPLRRSFSHIQHLLHSRVARACSIGFKPTALCSSIHDVQAPCSRHAPPHSQCHWASLHGQEVLCRLSSLSM